MAESAAHRPGQGARRVGLLLWPPEIIARHVPSCYEEGIQHRPLADSSAHGRQAKNHLAQQLQANDDSLRHGDASTSGRGSPKTSADSPLYDRGISVAKLLLHPHKARKGILQNSPKAVNWLHDTPPSPLASPEVAAWDRPT